MATEAQRNWTLAWKISGSGIVLLAVLSIVSTVKGYGRPLAIAALVITAPAASGWFVVWRVFG